MSGYSTWVFFYLGHSLVTIVVIWLLVCIILFQDSRLSNGSGNGKSFHWKWLKITKTHFFFIIICKVICESKQDQFWFCVNFNNIGQVSIFSRSMLLCWSINLCMNELRGNTRHLSFAWRRVQVSLTHTHGSSSHLSPVAGPCSHSTLFPLFHRHISYLKNDCFLAHPWNLPLTIMCSLSLSGPWY